MAGTPPGDHPAAFRRAPLDEAAGALAAVVDEVRPHVLITYDPHGGYGHPDHVQAHRVAMRATALAAHRVPRVLWNCVPRSAAERRVAELRAAGPGPFAGVAAVADIPGVTEDDTVALAVAGTPAQADAKRAAMAAHATQIEVAGDVFALSNGLAQPLWTVEYYRLAAGRPVPPGATGVFDGLEEEA
jgi:N-acetyl-1-D-myo-inositol-2-amino-2-deoxy-alpha-D-glucopyranoside deacetylase